MEFLGMPKELNDLSDRVLSHWFPPRKSSHAGAGEGRGPLEWRYNLTRGHFQYAKMVVQKCNLKSRMKLLYHTKIKLALLYSKFLQYLPPHELAKLVLPCTGGLQELVTHVVAANMRR